MRKSNFSEGKSTHLWDKSQTLRVFFCQIAIFFLKMFGQFAETPYLFTRKINDTLEICQNKAYSSIG
jgi:hypothetical protein